MPKYLKRCIDFDRSKFYFFIHDYLLKPKL